MHTTFYPRPGRPWALGALLVLAASCDDPSGNLMAPVDGVSAAKAPAGASVARITIVQNAVGAPGASVPAGRRFQLLARLYDGAGREIVGRRPQWVAVKPGVASIDTLGWVTPLSAGTTVFQARADGAAATTQISVVGSAASVKGGKGAQQDTVVKGNGAGPVTTSGASVTLAVRRFDGRSGAVTVSNSIPLRPGALRPGQEGQVRLTVAGQERRIYARVLEGVNPDGSARALLVQFDATLGAAETLVGRLDINAARPTQFTAAAPLVTPGGVPAAAALPTDPAYLVATGLVGPTLTTEQTATLGGSFAEYDRAFRTAADAHWSAEGDNWGDNYYDRALAYAAMWARSGNPDYWLRSARHAVAYRRDYLEANDYRASPHWSQLEGVATHYWLTGDEASRKAVSRTADELWTVVYYGNYMDWDQRINGRITLAQLLAWQVNGVERRAENMLPFSYTARLDKLIDVLTPWARADGSFDTGDSWCHGQANFMVGLLNDALIKTYTSYRQDPRIVAAVRRAVDYQWTTQWRADAGGFQYMNLVCRDNTTDPAGDLNGLIVTPFGWLANVTGDAKYRTQGDQVFAGLVRNAYLYGSKQFNQAYALSYRYLGYR